MGDLILCELSKMLVEDIQDPRLEMVMLSGVRMNANLRLAEILFTTHGGEASVEDALKALEKAKGYMRSNLGRRLNVKFLPDLRFTHDNLLEDMVYADPFKTDNDDDQE